MLEEVATVSEEPEEHCFVLDFWGLWVLRTFFRDPNMIIKLLWISATVQGLGCIFW